ncbi:hypothetical protein ACQY0O_001161 [Thecaphora frezii]
MHAHAPHQPPTTLHPSPHHRAYLHPHPTGDQAIPLNNAIGSANNNDQHDNDHQVFANHEPEAPPSSDDSSAAPTPNLTDSDELERFRREWQQEVQSRAAAASLKQSQRDQQKRTPPQQPGKNHDQGAASTPFRLAQTSTHDASDTGLEDEMMRLSMPIPEAEIYAPAALKYSDGAHKMPLAKRPANPTAPPTRARPVAADSEDFDVDQGLLAFSSVRGKSTSPTRTRFRDEIANAAVPFSMSSGSGRPLKAKATITGGNIIGLDGSVGASGSKSVASSLSMPATSRDAGDSTSSAIRAATEAYARAVEMERGGQLDEALISYRRAFKLHSDADRLYHRAQLLLLEPDVAPQKHDVVLSSPAVAEQVRRALDIDDHRFLAIQQRKMREAQAAERGGTYVEIPPQSGSDAAAAAAAAAGAAHPSALRTPLASESRPNELVKLLGQLSIEGGGERDFSYVGFVPADEEKEVLLSRLPDEILLHILRMVAAPRGRRGAKITKPRPTQEEVAAQQQQLSGRGLGGGGSGAGGDKHGKLGAADPDKPAAPASTASAGVANDTTASATATGAIATSGEAPESVNKPQAASRRHVGIGVVLGGADWQAIEHIGRTCWKLRLLTRSASIWKTIVQETYYPPLMLPVDTSLATLYAQHHHDWRTVFVNQPRLRLDGCYIAACHYARPGMSEESVWIRVVHVVEFYRSVRFLPDGRCLCLLTTDPPAQTVRKLEPNLKAKGFARGTWQLFPEGLEDDEEEGRPKGPKVTVEDLRDEAMKKYAFRMVFGLRQTARGRWNRLELLEYFS